MGLFSQPDTVNSRGDVLSDYDRRKLTNQQDSPFKLGDQSITPQQRAQMLYNWLTAGGPPKLPEPGKIFKEKQDMSGVEAKASAGQGINSLFGFGKMIGELSPTMEPVKPLESVLKPIKMIEPMNQSPMQTGVPYSTIPVPGGK